MKKRKLLFVAEELALNGAMNSMIALLKALPRDTYDISLFLFDHSGIMMHKLPSDIHLLPELTAYSVHRLSTKRAIVKAIKTFRFDLIIYRLLVSSQRRLKRNFNLWFWLPSIDFNCDVVIAYSDGFVAPMIQNKVRFGKKCCWVHFPYTKVPLLPFEYEALKQADACAVVSHTIGHELEEILGCKVKNLNVIHNIIDAEECKKNAMKDCPFPYKLGSSNIVSVGRATPAKGFDIIIPTAKELMKSGLDFDWYILGDGENLNNLILLTKENGIEDSVHFLGNVTNPMPWINFSDVVVQPSIFESWGMTVSEALCLGKAIVTSDIPVFAEQIIDGMNGFMCSLHPELIAEAILKILSDYELKHKLEKNAIAYPFTKDRIVDEFNTMISSLISL